jgi:hypothetical protein
MADNPPALEQHHCDAGANFVRIAGHSVIAPNKLSGGTFNIYDRSAMHKILDKIKEEFFAILPPTIFFFVALHILTFIRVLIARGSHFEPLSTASIAVASLILGKAVLIADMLPPINRYPSKPLAYNIAWKTAIYMVMATLIHYLERLIEFSRQAGGIVAGNERLLAEIVWPHFWAEEIILFLLILVYCTARELVRVIGKEKMLRLFFGPLPLPAF